VEVGQSHPIRSLVATVERAPEVVEARVERPLCGEQEIERGAHS
jgi:hypothetical protein